jgi:hypothetical protein
VKTRLHRWLGAAAIGGALFFLWTGTASAEPDVDLSGATIDVDDVLAAPEPTIDATPPVGAEALLGTNDVVVGDPDAPVAAEVVTSGRPDPTVVTPPAEADATVADSTASVVAPVATVDPDVLVCGNAVGVVGDAAADCDPAADDGTTGTTAEPGSVEAALGDSTPLPGTAVDGELPEVVADPDVLVCGNAVGVVGDAAAGCGPDGDAIPVADAGSLDLVLGGETPVSGTTLDSDLPGVVADPDAVVCGNGAGVIGDASGACAPAAAEEPLSPIDTFGLDVELGGTTPLEGSSAIVDASSTGIDPDAAVCGNGAGVLGDGTGTCGDTGSPVPALPVDPTGAVEVVLELGDLDPVAPALPDAPALPEVPDGPEAPETPIEAVPVEVGGLGTTTPVEPAPSPSPAPPPAPTRPGLGAGGPLTPIGSGAGGFGSVAPLGTASGAGAADLTVAGSTTAAELAAGAAAAALAFTGFGIRNALSLASVLLALGALLLVGRRRVELRYTVS